MRLVSCPTAHSLVNHGAQYLGCYEDYDAGRIMTLAEKKGRGYMTPEVRRQLR